MKHILITCLMFLLLSSKAWSAVNAKQPNILLILTDDQGYADVSFNGSQDIRTPNLDKLANAGTTFSSAYVVHPFCGPSRAGLLTGRYPHMFGSQFNLPRQKQAGGLGVPVEETYISSVLQQAGYYTGIVGKWHLGETAKYHPNNRGFDDFWGFLYGGHDYFPKEYERKYQAFKERGLDYAIPQYLVPLEHNGKEVRAKEYLTDELSKQAQRFIKSANDKQEPFFLYLAYNAPHTPLQAKEEDMAQFPNIKDKKRKTYAGMVWAVDRGVGQIVETLKETGQYENTLIVFLSDNGGKTSQGGNNYPLKEGKGSTHEGGYRTPMFMHWPEQVKPGHKYRHPVSALDLYPTFANLAGAKIPAQKKLDGKDLWPALKSNQSVRPGEPIYVMRHRLGYSDVGVRIDNFKALRINNGPWQLFDVENDPAEERDLANKYPDLLLELVANMEAWSVGHAQPKWFHNLDTAVEWRTHFMPRFNETFNLSQGLQSH
ncbi:sulfatase [Catenovulum agarivorans DS-2]|uniref:Sulfatase n=1 Tax=Catenovulum agarivorans DS-2 TaxID=1328313 RepID=W7QY68_9ALTE|nr:sulfatase-like hydrolase/transferase [Catenovulum agarivorans]EWH10250.1 sulfatase [Catenovulum agarivorans DS-2]